MMKHKTETGELVVKTLHVGEMASCCYIVAASDTEGLRGAIIDPGAEAARILDSAERLGARIDSIILTHAHADHIGGLEEVRGGLPDARVMVHKDDADMLGRPSLNLSLFLGGLIKCEPPHAELSDGDVVRIAGYQAEVIHIPGHTPGGTCLHIPAAGVVFTGDVLFAGGIGRSDFPGGDGRLLVKGIRERLLNLPPETVIYPGHGGSSTIGEEARSNPFL